MYIKEEVEEEEKVSPNLLYDEEDDSRLAENAGPVWRFLATCNVPNVLIFGGILISCTLAVRALSRKICRMK